MPEPGPASSSAGLPAHPHRHRDPLPAWSGEFSERDWQIVIGWNPEWSLTDVLANYDTCDLFARYLVENGAGHGTYHAALFGYCFLNDVRYLDANAGQSRLAIQAMFDAACRHLAASFEKFTMDIRVACHAAVTRQPVAIALDCGRASLRIKLEHAGRLYGQLSGVGYAGQLDGELIRAFQAGGTELLVGENDFGSLALVYDPPTFRLTALLDEAAVGANNAAILERLRSHRDTCCYLQLDDLVVLHEPEYGDDLVMAVLRLGCQQRYGHAHPGVVERIGRPGQGHFVVHYPPGPDPAAVRALVSARYAPRRVVIHPF